MTEAIKERIAKLLALGRNNSNEHEADAALRRAAKLMAEHGITEKDVSVSKIVLSDHIAINKMWKRTLAQAASALYGTQTFWAYDRESFRFTGSMAHVDASRETYEWLIQQVEFLYKNYLPKGLSQADRAHHRSRFKDACANRILVRVRIIMESLEQEKIPGTSLVVLDAVKQRKIEANDFLSKEMDAKTIKIKTVATVDRTSLSALIGLKAADSVELNKKVRS